MFNLHKGGNSVNFNSRQCHSQLPIARPFSCQSIQCGRLPYSKFNQLDSRINQYIQRIGTSRQCSTMAVQVSVYEYVLLMKLNEDVNEEKLNEITDNIWSLQYRIPGVLCVSCGNIMQQDPSTLGSYDLAFHFRFNHAQTIPWFTSNPHTKDVYEKNVFGVTQDYREFGYTGATDSSMESLFRRGDAWAQCVQTIYLLAQSLDTPDSPALDLDDLQIKAYSSAFGAIQVSQGGLLFNVRNRKGELEYDVEGGFTVAGEADDVGSHVMMVNFSAQEVSAAFGAEIETRLKEYGEACATKLLLAMTFDIAPTKSNKSNPGESRL